jgi:UDP-glucose 4-epimerase
MKKVLITGGSGFFGDVLKERLLAEGIQCVNIDLVDDPRIHPNLISIKGDIRDTSLMDQIFSRYRFDAVYHCAALLAHSVKDVKELWSCNVEGTRNIARLAQKYRVPKVVYISSNCLWAESFKVLVTEEETPRPVEIYGKSKLECEKILLESTNSFDTIIFRSPTIVSAGRLGLLAILFEYVEEGRRVWMVGDGSNRYQFIYACDLAEACVKALEHNGNAVYNIGSDNVKTVKEVYTCLIQSAGTKARTASIPKRPGLALLKAAHALGVSPLGRYHYMMISSDFIFDTSKIKRELDWRPTRMNEEMLCEAYEYYRKNKEEITGRRGVSAHRSPAKQGILKILKKVS